LVDIGDETNVQRYMVFYHAYFWYFFYNYDRATGHPKAHQKQNVYYLNYSLPETYKVIVKRGSLEHDVQIINGKLKHDVFIDLGDSQAHVFIKNNNLMLEYFSGQKASYKNWKDYKNNIE